MTSGRNCRFGDAYLAMFVQRTGRMAADRAIVGTGTVKRFLYRCNRDIHDKSETHDATTKRVATRPTKISSDLLPRHCSCNLDFKLSDVSPTTRRCYRPSFMEEQEMFTWIVAFLLTASLIIGMACVGILGVVGLSMLISSLGEWLFSYTFSPEFGPRRTGAACL